MVVIIMTMTISLSSPSILAIAINLVLVYWLCLVSDAAWIVLDCSTSLVLIVPRFGCCLDCS